MMELRRAYHLHDFKSYVNKKTKSLLGGAKKKTALDICMFMHCIFV